MVNPWGVCDYFFNKLEGHSLDRLPLPNTKDLKIKIKTTYSKIEILDQVSFGGSIKI